MIEKFEISGYRSCIETQIDLQPDLSVLIGPNGTGKTNILNALLLLRSLTAERESMGTGDEPANICHLKATFKLEEKRAVLSTDIHLLTDENNGDMIIGSDQSWYAKDFTNNRKRIKIPLWMARLMVFPNENYDLRLRRYALMYKRHKNVEVPAEFSKPLGQIIEFLRDIKYYSASQFTNPSLCPVSIEVEQEGPRRRGIGVRGVHNRFLYDLYGARKTESFQSFFDVIGPDGIGLVDNVEFKEISTSSIDYLVRSGGKIHQRKREKLLVIPQFTIGRDELSPSQLSEGTFKTITLLFYLITEQSSALLIEEPEVCVHHGLLSSIIELIKNYSQKKQIIISTHSDFVLDQIEPRHVYKVSRLAQKGTVVEKILTSMSARELYALKNYLETEGNLGEYWRHGGLD